MSVFLSAWGAYNKNGCPDRSDIVVGMDENFECGEKYGWLEYRRKVSEKGIRLPEFIETTEYVDVKWKWFKCINKRKCIHPNSRCDLHPHPDCIYEKNGHFVAEDEEDCLDEYKSKGLVTKSANFECTSAVHNSDTIAIQSSVEKVLFGSTYIQCLT